jgi:2-iminoacetate synthase ThiH
MTSKLVTALLESSGLVALLAERERGVVPSGAEGAQLVERSDLFALGAAADLARRRECGDETRIHVPAAPPSTSEVLLVGPEAAGGGTALLRRIARERLLGPIGRRIVVDFGALGLEIAQVALSFGATDLAGPIASRRGLPMLDADDQKKLVKRREIAGFVERAGFRPVFVTTHPGAEGPSAPSDAPTRPHVDS